MRIASIMHQNQIKKAKLIDWGIRWSMYLLSGHTLAQCWWGDAG
jgi:hypothetical protein